MQSAIKTHTQACKCIQNRHTWVIHLDGLMQSGSTVNFFCPGQTCFAAAAAGFSKSAASSSSDLPSSLGVLRYQRINPIVSLVLVQ